LTYFYVSNYAEKATKIVWSKWLSTDIFFSVIPGPISIYIGREKTKLVDLKNTPQEIFSLESDRAN